MPTSLRRISSCQWAFVASRDKIGGEVEEAIAALHEAGDTAADDLAGRGEVHQDGISPRRLRTIDCGGGLTGLHIVAKFGKRLPETVVGAVNVVIAAPDFHQARRVRSLAEIDVRQAADVFKDSLDSALGDGDRFDGGCAGPAQFGANGCD
jgi:hypothetical protein